MTRPTLVCICCEKRGQKPFIFGITDKQSFLIDSADECAFFCQAQKLIKSVSILRNNVSFGNLVANHLRRIDSMIGAMYLAEGNHLRA